MWNRHLFNLLGSAWQNLLSALSTSTLTVVVFSVAIPATVFITVSAYRLYRVIREGGDVLSALKPTIVPTAIAAGVTVVGWTGLFGWSVAETIYKDHGAFVQRTADLENANTKLLKENSALRSIPPKIGTRTAPSPSVEQEKKCWASNEFGMANSKVPGSVTATEAILRCNYKIDAPFQVAVKFDRDFILGAISLPDTGGFVASGGATKQGTVYISPVIQTPALLSNYLVIVTVYGTTDQYPRALTGGIKSLN